MSRSSSRLEGRVVAITGAARGIGAATAKALHAAGARVAIGDLDLALAEQTAAEIGVGVLALPLDVTDHAGFTAFLDDVEARLGPLDVLVNNAGIMPVGRFDDEDPALTDKQIAINLVAVIHGSREAVRRMTLRGSGHIVNIASAAGKMGMVGVATYCATKHGVVGLSESLRRELHGSGVEVSCVMPGIVRTELSVGLKDRWYLPSVGPDEVADAIVRAVAEKRYAVNIPRTAPVMAAAFTLMPVRLGDRIARRLGGDTVMLDAAHDPARVRYEARAAAGTAGATTTDGADQEAGAVVNR